MEHISDESKAVADINGDGLVDSSNALAALLLYVVHHSKT